MAHPRPAPEDFAAVFGTMRVLDMAKHYRTAARTIERWRRELGLDKVRVTTVQNRPMPEDFAVMARTLTKMQLAKHYHAGRPAIMRWLAEANVTPFEYVPVAPKRVKSPKWKGVSVGIKNNYGNLTITRATSVYEDAARDIQRYAPVYRCTEKGIADGNGKFWRIGSAMSVLTPDELLVRAERYRSRAA